jgi:hypothetical protein
MAHHRLGHAERARDDLNRAVRWLEQSTQKDPKDETFGVNVPWEFWLIMQLLRCEAEALILYDTAFPSDPFAP